MQRVRVESAACFVDACPIHGTWFDAGELEDVMRAYDRARQHGSLGAVGPAMGPAHTVHFSADEAR